VPARAGRLRHSKLFGGSAAIEDIDHTRTKTSRRLPGAVELDALSHDDAFLSVPTKFLKSWIQSHYVDRILATLASDFPAIKRVFCHTLNALIDSRRQIVTAADRPPGDLVRVLTKESDHGWRAGFASKSARSTKGCG
jgi:chromosomal replication initiation ATPase DnaA